MTNKFKNLDLRDGISRTSIIAVFVCLGILIAMILPAILQVRAAARQATLMNNMRQIALACHNYESAHRHFPPASPTLSYNGPEFSWLVELMPFIEANNLPDSIYPGRNWDHPLNAPVFSIEYPTFISPHEKYLRNENGFGLTHFAGSPDIFDRKGGNKTREELSGSDVLIGEVCDGYLPWAAAANVRSIENGIQFDSTSFGSPVKAGATFAYVDGSGGFVSSESPRPAGRFEDLKMRLRPVKVNTSSLDHLQHQLRRVGPSQKGFVIFAPTNDYMKYGREEIGNAISNADLESLSNIKNLVGIDLHHKRITDNGMRYFEEMHDLETLVIEGGQLSQAGLKHLLGLKKLTTLRICNRVFNDEALVELRTALPNCEIIFP